MTLGKFIRSAREDHFMTLRALAQGLGISPAYWSRVERDQNPVPSDVLLLKFAEILSIDSGDVFIAAKRLPPDMRPALAEIVAMYRKHQLRSVISVG